DPVGGQARRARLHVPLQAFPRGLIAFVVEEQPHVRDHCGAVQLVGSFAGHRSLSCPAGAASAAFAAAPLPALVFFDPDVSMPSSRATTASNPRNRLRPRCGRHITVPVGVSTISAISLYGKPSTSAEYTAIRNSSGSCCSASLMFSFGIASIGSTSADL